MFPNGQPFRRRELLAVPLGGVALAASDAVAQPLPVGTSVVTLPSLVGASGAVHVARTVPESAFVRTEGYARPGDGGGALYQPASGQPDHDGCFTDGRGRWWELAEQAGRPEMFGAKGDYDQRTGSGTDDSEAFARLVRWCVHPPGDVTRPCFLSRHYLVRRNNVFGLVPGPARTKLGWDIIGSGMSYCSITFRPGADRGTAPAYLYDGLPGSRRAEGGINVIGLSFRNMTLALKADDVPDGDAVSWFRAHAASGQAPQQAWTFENVFFRGDENFRKRNGWILKIEGSENCSENAFNFCRGYWFRSVIDCTNRQAVNHLSNFCHWELATGDVFRFVQGGSLTVTGGSIILDVGTAEPPALKPGEARQRGQVAYADGRRYVSDGRTPELPRRENGGRVEGWAFEADESMYLLRLTGASLGESHGFSFLGVRLEMRSQRAKIIGGGDPLTTSVVVFDGCNFQYNGGAARSAIELPDSRVQVIFRDCQLALPSRDFASGTLITFKNGGQPAQTKRNFVGPLVKFIGGYLNPDIHDTIIWEPGAVGTVVTEGVQPGVVETSPGRGQREIALVNGTSRNDDYVENSALAVSDEIGSRTIELADLTVGDRVTVKVPNAVAIFRIGAIARSGSRLGAAVLRVSSLDGTARGDVPLSATGILQSIAVDLSRVRGQPHGFRVELVGTAGDKLERCALVLNGG